MGVRGWGWGEGGARSRRPSCPWALLAPAPPPHTPSVRAPHATPGFCFPLVVVFGMAPPARVLYKSRRFAAGPEPAGGTAWSAPAAPRSPAGPERSHLPKPLHRGFSTNSVWVQRAPPGAPSSFCSALCFDSYTFLCRAALTCGRRTPLNYSSGMLLPTAYSGMGAGSGLLSYFEEHFHSFLLSPLKLLAHSGQLLSALSSLRASASRVHVWIRISRRSWLECSIPDTSPKILILGGQGRVTSGAWESEFFKQPCCGPQSTLGEAFSTAGTDICGAQIKSIKEGPYYMFKYL